MAFHNSYIFWHFGANIRDFALQIYFDVEYLNYTGWLKSRVNFMVATFVCVRKHQVLHYQL